LAQYKVIFPTATVLKFVERWNSNEPPFKPVLTLDMHKSNQLFFDAIRKAIKMMIKSETVAFSSSSIW